MATLEAIRMKMKSLQAQAEAIIEKQASAALDRIRDLMERHGVTIADIEAHVGGGKRGPLRGAKSAVDAKTSAAKYRDPKTGLTWSGRGRTPGWIANVKDRTRFLVDTNAPSPASAAASKAKTVGHYVRGPQPPKYRDPRTGATWSGRGPAPAWLAAAKDRSKFLIDGLGTVATETSAARKAGTAKSSATGGAVAKKAAAKKLVAKKAVVAKKVVSAKKAAVKRAPETKSATPASKRGAVKKAALPTAKKAAVRKAPSTKAVAAKEAVAKPEVTAAPESVAVEAGA